jgi:hypothetical protein
VARSPETGLLKRANTSYDDAVRGKAYLEARRLIAADARTIPTIHREDVHALRAGVTGFRPNGVTIFCVMDSDVKSAESVLDRWVSADL